MLSVMPLLKEGIEFDPDVLIRLTPSRMAMAVHALWVNAERQDERLKRDRTCYYCKEESVIKGKCTADDCKKPQPQAVKIKAGVYETIEWPPGSGRVYRGDERKSALQKLKEADLDGYTRYNLGVFARARR